MASILSGEPGQDQPELPDHVLLWFEAAQRRVSRELDPILDPSVAAIGPRRLRILELIPPDGIRQTDLAARALITKQALGPLIDALEADGLIERSPDPADGRAWIVSLSVAGMAATDALDASIARVEALLADETGAADWAVFLKVLRAIGEHEIAEDDTSRHVLTSAVAAD